jgi:hypothetical protein
MRIMVDSFLAVADIGEQDCISATLGLQARGFEGADFNAILRAVFSL